MHIWVLMRLYIDISNIRTLLQVRVRTQDPKPKKNMERSTRAIPLYHIVLLFLSQPRNVRRLQGPPVYIFFGRWQTTLVGGLQSTQPSWHIYTCWFQVASFPFLFRFTWKWDFAVATLPLDTCTHDIRYRCPGSSSGLMTFKWKWWCTMALPSAMYIYCHFLPNESVITFGLQCQ